MSLIAELKRRNVFRVGAAYAIVAWLLVEVASVVLPALHLPDWTLTFLVFLLAVGFPIALIFAWAFELTPEGIKRETAVDPAESTTKQTGRKLDFIIIGVLAVGIVYFAVDKFVLETEPEQAVVTTDSIPEAEPVERERSIRSLAVLPLENLSGDPEQEYFAAGMHEALISSLARIGTGLRVISRTSAIQIDREGRTIPEIAAQLGVDSVIEGSAMREGDQVRVTVQLIDARRDDHIWAQSYDREFSTALALTREISREVAGQIRLVLSPERERLLTDTRPVDPQALDLYLSGMQHVNRVTLPDARRAIQLFEASIAADPSFARAFEGLARVYLRLMGNIWTISSEEALPKMRDAASRALELDGTLAEAHALLAQARWAMEFEWVETEKSLSRALALEPMNVGVIGIFSWFLQCSGRIEEGLELMERAVAADPLNPVTRTEFGWQLYHARRFRRVIEEANRILERDPGFAWAYELLFASHAALGDWEASRNADRQFAALGGRPQWVWEALDRGYEQGGFKGSRRAFLAAIREHDDGSISHVVRAIQACFLEEPDEAIVELNHAIRMRDPLVLEIGGFPTFDCVRSDPRFQDLLRKINWPGLKE